MLTWNGLPIRDYMLGRLYDPDNMPYWLRKEFEKEMERWSWEDTLDDILALPEAPIDPWITEPGEFLR